MPKAIFFDVDNTLTDETTHQLVPSAILALKKLQKAGILVIVATSRVLCELSMFKEVFDFDAMILASGGKIYVNGKTIKSYCFTRKELQHIIDFRNSAEDINIVYSAVDKCVYVEKMEDVRNYPWFYENDVPFEIREIHPDDQVFQLFIHGSKKADQEFLDKMKDSDVKYQFYSYMSVYPRKTNKGVACKELIEHLGLRAEECACVGDSLNDIEMFEVIKQSYCMGNGKEELKSIAHQVIGNAEENGVYNLCIEKGWIN